MSENNEFLNFLVKYELELSVKGDAAKQAKTTSDSVSGQLRKLKKDIDELANTNIVNPKMFVSAVTQFENLKKELTHVMSGMFADALKDGDKDVSAAANLKATKFVETYMGSFDRHFIKASKQLRKQEVQQAIETENAVQAAREKRTKLARKRPALEERVSGLKSAGVDTKLIERQLKDFDKEMGNALQGKGNVKELDNQWDKVNQTVTYYIASLRNEQKLLKENNVELKLAHKLIEEAKKAKVQAVENYGKQKDVRLNIESGSLEKIGSDQSDRDHYILMNELHDQKMKNEKEFYSKEQKTFDEEIKHGKKILDLNEKLLEQEENLLRLQEEEAILLYKLESFKSKDYSEIEQESIERAQAKKLQFETELANKREEINQKLFLAELRRSQQLASASISASDKRTAIERATQIQITRMKRTGIDSGMKPGIDSQAQNVLLMSQNPDIPVKQLDDAYKSLINTIKQATEVQKNEDKVLADKNNRFQTLRKMMYDVQNVTNTAMMYLGGFTAAVTGLFAKIGSVFGEYEATVNRFKAVTFEAGMPMEEVNLVGKRFSKTVLEIAENSKFSATEIAEAGVVMAKLGFTATQTEQALRGVVLAAEASGESIELVAETISGIINGFGMNATQAEHVADVLTTSALKSATDFRTLGETFKYIAPLAAATGQSFEETAGLVSLLGKNMILSSQGGTTLRQALIRLVNITPEAKKQLDALGINAADPLTGRLKPLKDILVDMSDKMKGLSNSTKLAALSTIFGERAVTGMAAALNQIAENKGAVDELIRFHTEADGITKDIKKIAFDGVIAEFKKLQAMISVVVIQLGEDLAPAMKDIISIAKGVVGAFKEIPTLFNQVAFGGVAAVGAIAGVTLGFTALAKAAAGAVQSVLVFEGILSMLKAGTFFSTLFAGSMTSAGLATAGAGVAAATGATGFALLGAILIPLIALVVAVAGVATVIGGTLWAWGKEQDALTAQIEAANETLVVKNKLLRESADLNRKEAEGIKLTAQELRKQAAAYSLRANEMKKTLKLQIAEAKGDIDAAKSKQLDPKYIALELTGFNPLKADVEDEIKAAEIYYNALLEKQKAYDKLSEDLNEKHNQKLAESTKRQNYENLKEKRDSQERVIDMLYRANEEAITPEVKKNTQELLNREMKEYAEIIKQIAEMEKESVLTSEEIIENTHKRYENEKMSMKLTGGLNDENQTLLDLIKKQNDERQKTLDIQQKISENEIKIKYLKEAGVDTSGLSSSYTPRASGVQSEIDRKIAFDKKLKQQKIDAQAKSGTKEALEKAISDTKKNEKPQIITETANMLGSAIIKSAQSIKTKSKEYTPQERRELNLNQHGATDFRAKQQAEENERLQRINRAKEIAKMEREHAEYVKKFGSKPSSQRTSERILPNGQLEITNADGTKKIVGDQSGNRSGAALPASRGSGGSGVSSYSNVSRRSSSSSNFAQTRENMEQRQAEDESYNKRIGLVNVLKQKEEDLAKLKKHISEGVFADEKAKQEFLDLEEQINNDIVDVKGQILDLDQQIEQERRNRIKKNEDYKRSLILERLEIEQEIAEATLNTEIDDIMTSHKLSMSNIDDEARKKKEEAEAMLLGEKELADRKSQIDKQAADKKKRLENKTAREIALQRIEEENRINDLIVKNNQLMIEMMPDSYDKTIEEISSKFESERKSLQDSINRSTNNLEKEELKNSVELLNEKEIAEKQKAKNEEQFKQIDNQKQILDLQYQQNTLLGEFLDISSSIGKTRYADSLKDAFDAFRGLDKPVSVGRQQIQEAAKEFDKIIDLDQKRLAEVQKQLKAEKEKGEESYQYQALLLQEKQLQQEITDKILAQKQLTSETFIQYKEQINALEQIRVKYDQITSTIDKLSPAISTMFDGALTTGIANLNKISASMFEVGKNMIDLSAKAQQFTDLDKNRLANPKDLQNLFSQWKIDRGNTGGKNLELGLEKSTNNTKDTLGNAVNTFVKNIPGELSKMFSAIAPVIGAFAPLIIEGLNFIATTWDDVFSEKRTRQTQKMFRDIQSQAIESFERINDYIYNRGDLSEALFDSNKLIIAGQKYTSKVAEIKASLQQERDDARNKNILNVASGSVVAGLAGFAAPAIIKGLIDKEAKIYGATLEELNKKEAFLLQEAELEKRQIQNNIYADSFARQSKSRIELLTANSQAAMAKAQIGQNPILIAQQELANAEISIQKQKDDAIEKLIRSGGLNNVRAQEIFIAEMQALNAQAEKNEIDHVNKMINIENEYFNRDQQNAKRKVELNRKMSESDRTLAAQRIDLQTELRNIDDKIATEKDPRTLEQLRQERADVLAAGLQKLKDSAHNAQIQLQLLNLEMSGLAANLSSGQTDDYLNDLSIAFVNIDEKIRDLKIANPDKDFSKYKNDLNLKEIRETNDKIFANDQELKSKEAQANIDSADVFAQTENTIRMTSNKTTQELIDNLEYIKVKHGENSIEFKSEEKKAQAETLKIAKQTFDGLVALYNEDLNVYSDIQKMKAEMTADPFDNVLAEFDSATAANQLEQWVLKQQMNNTTDPKQIARLEQKMKQLKTQAESIQKQAVRGAGDAAINQLEQIKELREQIFDQETKVYQLDIKKYQREIQLKQREIELKNREKDAILKDIERQKKAFSKTDIQDFNKLKDSLDFDKELQDALEYISNPLGNLPFKNVDGQMVFEPAGQTAMEAGNKRAEVLRAQAEASYIKEEFDPENETRNAELYYNKLAEIAGQKAVFADYAQEKIKEQHKAELTRLAELGKTEDELRIVKNRQKDEELAAIEYLTNAIQEYKSAKNSAIENSKGVELEAIQEVIDLREDENEDLNDKLEDSQWEVEKASMKMADDLEVVEQAMKNIGLATGQWSFTLNQVKNNLPGLVTQVVESLTQMQSDIQSRKIEIPLTFPSEFVTIMRELQALIPRLPQLVSASGSYGGSGAQNTSAAQSAAVSGADPLDEHKQYILNPKTGKYEFRLPDNFQTAQAGALQLASNWLSQGGLSWKGFAQGGMSDSRTGGTSDYIAAMLRPREIVAPERDFKSLVQDWTYDRMKRERGVVNNGGNNYEFNFGNVYGVDDLKGTVKDIIRDVSKQGGYYNGIYTVNSN